MTARTKYSLMVLLLFHTIGVVLFMTDPNASKLSWITLLISGVALIIDEKLSLKKVLIFTGIFIAGYLIELLGTKTGLLFGEYEYGSSLGFKVLGVPLIIGLNWVITVTASSAIAKRYIKSSLILQALVAAALCTLLDIAIEPVAVQYDFWSWGNGIIPIFNYLCWFGFSFIFSLFYIYKNTSINKTAYNIYLIWIVFFLILNFL